MRREQVRRQHEEHSCRGGTSSRAPEGAMRREHVHRQHEEHSCRGRTSSRAPEGAERREQVHRQHEEYSSGGSTSSEAPEGAERREQVRRQHEEHSSGGSTSSGAPEGAERREQVRRQHEEHSSTSLLRPREQHDGNTFAVNKRRTRQRRWFGWFQDFHQPRKRKEERLPIALDTKGIEKSEGALKDLCYRENREPNGNRVPGFCTRISLSVIDER